MSASLTHQPTTAKSHIPLQLLAAHLKTNSYPIKTFTIASLRVKSRLTSLLRTMSTISGSAEKGPAPWKDAFLSNLSKLESPEFVLSTVEKAPNDSPVPYVPRARYCIFRGFWAELPENKHNEAPQNDRVYESDLPTFSTDIRMHKVPQIFGSSAGHASNEDQWQGSGGGGPVEAVYWVKPTMTQWRIKGDAFILGPDIEGDGEESSGVRTVKSEVGKRMRVVKPGKEAGWSWAKEITAHFGNTSPGLRGQCPCPRFFSFPCFYCRTSFSSGHECLRWSVDIFRRGDTREAEIERRR